jgi:hypothetical protein
MGVAALVLGIIGLLASLNPWLVFVSVPLGIIAIILGVIGRRAGVRDHLPTSSATAGMVLGICAVVVAALMWVVCTMVVRSVGNSLEKNIGEPIKKAMEEAQKEEEREAKGQIEIDHVGAVKVTAAELAAAYETNPFAADQKYKNKTLRVTGTVLKITSLIERAKISLVTTGDAQKDEWGGVECRLTTAETPKAAKLKPGDKVTVLGNFKGHVIDYALRGCVME